MVYRRVPKVTKEQFVAAVEGAESIQEVGKRLNYNPGGSMYDRIKGLALYYGVELPVFNYRTATKKATKRNRLTTEEWFVRDVLRSGANTRDKLIKLGKEYKCEGIECPLAYENPQWGGRPITLHVDHIDGDKFNNTIKNLRFLCPNCHQQTDTWGNKKR